MSSIITINVKKYIILLRYLLHIGGRFTIINKVGIFSIFSSIQQTNTRHFLATTKSFSNDNQLKTPYKSNKSYTSLSYHPQFSHQKINQKVKNLTPSK